MTVRTLPYQEAQLLSVFFEEVALHNAETAHNSPGSKSPRFSSDTADYETDSTVGDSDEVDAFTAMKRAGRLKVKKK